MYLIWQLARRCLVQRPTCDQRQKYFQDQPHLIALNIVLTYYNLTMFCLPEFDSVGLIVSRVAARRAKESRLRASNLSSKYMSRLTSARLCEIPLCARGEISLHSEGFKTFS